MSPFLFATTAQILCESGSAVRLAELCKERGATRVMIVTDPGITKLGMLNDILPGFAKIGMAVEIFDEVQADPPESVVMAAVEQGRAMKADLVVGFGGGSSMDVAKLVAFLVHPGCQQQLADIYGVGNAKGQRLPLIQVPTTAGTGSEVTQISIITTGETTKMGVVSPILLPDMALLDANLDEAVHNGNNREARQAMLLGALLAGQAFANAPVAAVHALAYPLGGHFHIPHGLSNALVLPAVIDFNASAAEHLYAELAPLLVKNLKAGNAASLTEQLVAELSDLSPRCKLPTRLRDAGVPEDMLPQLAKDAMLQQRLLVNNPRELTEADALAIYRKAY